MEREQLEAVAAQVPAVGTILNITSMDCQLTDGDRARIAFRVLLQNRAALAAGLRRRGLGVTLLPVVWPRDPEEQAAVLRYLHSDCAQLESALAGPGAALAVA